MPRSGSQFESERVTLPDAGGKYFVHNTVPLEAGFRLTAVTFAPNKDTVPKEAVGCPPKEP